MECSLQPQSTTDGMSVLATMPPTPPPSIDQVVKPTSMDHLVKLRVHAIETCKTNGRATFCYHHSVRPKLVGSTEKVVAVGCGSWPQRLAPSARPLAPQRCPRSLPRRGHCLCRLGRCRLLTPDARQGPLLEWHRAALAPQRCPRSHPRRCHCHCPLCRCRLLTTDARRGQLLECHRAAPDVRAVIGIVVVMPRCLPTDFRNRRLVTGVQPVRFGRPSPRGQRCVHDDAHRRRHAKRQRLRIFTLDQRVHPCITT